jgi:tryptophan-rich sensory protein
MNYRALLVFTAACTAIAAGGARVTTPALRSEWYQTLRKPSWQPPSVVFGPVWSLLYLLIALSGGHLFSAQGANPAQAKALYLSQLVLNAVWSPTFFGRPSVRGGLLVIVALWINIAAFILSAWRRRKLAAWLFVPYGFWVSYATALNAWIWKNNRS